MLFTLQRPACPPPSLGCLWMGMPLGMMMPSKCLTRQASRSPRLPTCGRDAELILPVCTAAFLPAFKVHALHSPSAVRRLPQLQRLQLRECNYSAESMQQLSALSGSLTRLATYNVELFASSLPVLTRLQHFSCLLEYQGHGDAICNALQHLTGLTCLVSWLAWRDPCLHLF